MRYSVALRRLLATPLVPLLVAAAIGAASASTACGKKKQAPPPPPVAKPIDAKAIVAQLAERAAPGVNALVPEELAGKLRFVAALTADGKFAIVVPAGWKPDADGEWRPTDDVLGVSTTYTVARSEADPFTPYRGMTVMDPGPAREGGKVLLAKSLDHTIVVFQERRPWFCRAELDVEAAPAAMAFLAACRAMTSVAP